MPRNHNLGTSTLRNRNRVTNKTRLKVVHGTIDADPLVLDEDEEKARIVSTAGVDAEDANEHHLQAVLSAASQRHQSVGRPTRGGAAEKPAAPAAFIPTPDSNGLVDNYAELYPPDRWRDPASYIKSSETVEEACSNALIDAFTYLMDERDKDWLDRNNEEARGEGTSAQGAVSTPGTTTRSGLSQRSAKSKGKEPESAQPVGITEDEFELVMGIFEKVTHEKTEFLHHGLESGMAFPPFTDYQDTFSSPLAPSTFATFTVPSWIPPPAQLLRLARSIYPHWRERRQERGGHRIIPVLNYDESDVTNESYICFRRREIKAIRKTRASQATSSDKLIRLQAELVQSMELAKMLLSRETMKQDSVQQALQVCEKRLEFVDLKRKFPSLGVKEDDELLYDKERAVKKIKVEANGRLGIKLRTGGNGDPGSPALPVEIAIRPKERLSMISAAMDRDLLRKKERDHGYEDVTENAYQRPAFPTHRRLWKAIHSSRTSASPPLDEEGDMDSDSHVRYLRLRHTRTGGAAVDRRDAFLQRLGIRVDDATVPQRRDAFTRRLEELVTDEDEEHRSRLRERWKFDQDDDPVIAPEGSEEQDRLLVDDYDTKYLRHMMTLLTDQDQQYINNDPTLIFVTPEGRQQPVVPFRTGTQQPYVRRDLQAAQRVYTPGVVPQIAASRPVNGMPLPSLPNGVPIAMQAHMKAMQPPSAIPHMRISSNGGMRPPVLANVTTPASQQSSPPRTPSTPTGGGVNGTLPVADGDTVKLTSNVNGVSHNNTTPQAAQQPTNEVNLSPLDGVQQAQQQAGSPARPKSDAQHAGVVAANGYHVTMNGYPTMTNGTAYAHSRQHSGLPMQHMQNMQNVKMVFAPGQDITAMHANQGRPLSTPYMGHVVPAGAHFNMQLSAGANVNLKLPAGRQWASPLQQPAPLGNGADGVTGAGAMASSPHAAPGSLPARTPSANGSRPPNRTPSVNGVPVGHMMGNGQYSSHSLSPHLQHSPSPLSSALALPAHQSPPRPPLTPTMKMTSPSLQHQQQPVGSSQGGY
ncbi:hypothetical protein BV22DRAFT_1015104 [Leucogyrophana mollusca]|uniref:Uncharacterized protein n=1 Tax=Leucogyrophana mollusca TaxID=85980 RepID=A0ACB8BCX3_9AGAM|nr:hypothetical protein BV22DRAFT_1015104 [Leucogyrophana mollusca]